MYGNFGTNSTLQTMPAMYNYAYSQPQIQYQYIPVIQPIIQQVPLFYSSSTKNQQLKNRALSTKNKKSKKSKIKRGKSYHSKTKPFELDETKVFNIV